MRSNTPIYIYIYKYIYYYSRETSFLGEYAFFSVLISNFSVFNTWINILLTLKKKKIKH